MDWTTVKNNKRRNSQNSEDNPIKKSFPDAFPEESNTKNEVNTVAMTKAINKPTFTEYQSDNKGPFTVWIQPIIPTEASNSNLPKSLSPFKVGRLVCKKYASIKYICRKSKSRVEIDFKNPHEANQLLKDPSLTENGLKAYIPSFRLIRRGLIKGIDEDISEDEIIGAVESEFKVVQARRLNKRNRDPNAQEKDPKWVPSRSVVITFSGQSIPNEIFIHKIRINVEPYMTLPITCYNCFKLGHTSSNCRGDAKCSMCGETKHNEQCLSSTPKCANCKGDHISTDKNCSFYRKELEVKRLMAFENLAMSDARKLVYKNFKKLTNSGSENFPSLKGKPFTPYNEAVKGGKNHHTTVKEKHVSHPSVSNQSSNLHYKFQRNNCEDFIGPRDFSSTSKGVALQKPPATFQKTILTTKENLNSNGSFQNKENTTQPSQPVNQRQVLSDLSNLNNSSTMKSGLGKLPSSFHSHVTKPLKTYQKSSKESPNLHNSLLKSTNK